MTDGSAKNAVLLTMAGSTLLIVGDDIVKDHTIHGTHVVALGLVFVGLSVASDIQPKIAAAFSVLLLIGIALTKGPDIFNAFGNVGSGSIPGPKGQTTTPSGAAKGTVVPPKTAHRTSGPAIPGMATINIHVPRGA